MAGGITYGTAKAQLATVVANGVGETDARVMPRTNEAIQAILGFDFICVNGMMTANVVSTTESGKQVLLLPKELWSATEVEVLSPGTVLSQTDVAQGWAMVTNFTYIDPANAHDNPLIDLGLVPDGGDPTILRRKYEYPGLSAGATVRVTGPKTYVPITADGDYLIVQNLPAVKIMILSIERYENNDRENAKAYKDDAKTLLLDEVKKFQMDPTNSLKRKAAYQADLITYAEGTLGRTRARLALELRGFLMMGKAEITYLVNRAVQMLVDSRNQLAIAGRISVHGTITELVYAPATAPATALAWDDYNDIRLMVQSFVVMDAAVAAQSPYAIQGDAALAQQMQQQAMESQKAKLIEAAEKERHTTYTTALSNFPVQSYGWTVARMALELEAGLKLTTTELERAVDRAESRLMEKGLWRGTLEEFTADIVGGEVLFPVRVLGILAADVCGMPVDIRAIFFDYQKNGPGKMCSCESKFTDLGEVYFADDGNTRRRYRFDGNTTASTINVVAKLRWIKKENADQMTLKNFEAMRLMVSAILLERAEKWQESVVATQLAVAELEKDLSDFLGGLQFQVNVEMNGMGMGGLGGVH
jgi:hypothetical protein